MARDVRLKITALDRTSRAFRSVGKRAAKLGLTMAKVGAGMSIGAGAAGVALVKSSMESVDALAKVSDKIGTTTEALSALQYAGELTGVKTETMNMALQRFTRRVSEASAGTGEAKGALAELGLNAEVLNQMPLDKKMATLADAFATVPTQADRVRLSFKLFDSEGVQLVSTLMQGREGLAEFAREADHLGLTVSRVDAAQIEAANDAVTRAKKVFTGLGNQLATSFSPLIQGVADAFRQSALDTEDFGSIGQRVLGALIKAVGVMGDAVFGVQIAWMEFKIAFFQIVESVKGVWLSFLDLIPSMDFLDPLKDSFTDFFGWIGDKAKQGIAAITGSLQDATTSGETFSESLGTVTAETAAMTAQLEAMYLRMGSAPPSDAIDAWFEKIYTNARRTAELVAESAPGTVLLNDANSNLDAAGNLIAQKMSFIQKMGKEGAKKQTAFMALTHTERTQNAVKSMRGLFGKNKALQIAEALMNTYTGATLALKSYPGPLGVAFAAATVAAGLQNVAQIRAQTPSFLGGGFTGNGARAGGLDGRGGFMAMLHPNESVSDLSKGGAGITVVNNIDATGADAGVELRVRRAIEESQQQTVAVIQDLMKRRRFV